MTSLCILNKSVSGSAIACEPAHIWGTRASGKERKWKMENGKRSGRAESGEEGIAFHFPSSLFAARACAPNVSRLAG